MRLIKNNIPRNLTEVFRRSSNITQSESMWKRISNGVSQKATNLVFLKPKLHIRRAVTLNIAPQDWYYNIYALSSEDIIRVSVNNQTNRCISRIMSDA
jgi:hypothetical protein